MKNITFGLLLATSLCAATAHAGIVTIHEDSFSAGVSLTQTSRTDGSSRTTSKFYQGGLFSDDSNKTSFVQGRDFFIESTGVFFDDFFRAAVTIAQNPNYSLNGYFENVDGYVNWDVTFSAQGGVEFLYGMEEGYGDEVYGNNYDSSATRENWSSLQFMNVTTQQQVEFDIDPVVVTPLGTLVDGDVYTLSLRLYVYDNIPGDYMIGFYGDFLGATIDNQAAGVPEPSMIALMLLGLGGLSLRKKKLS